MKLQRDVPHSFTLPLPAWVLHPLTAVGIFVLHVYLAVGHLSKLFSGPAHWTDIWKGFGALAGAYVFAALASRAFARRKNQNLPVTAAA
jgi:prolipoprotein diacylglyceryltransferase